MTETTKTQAQTDLEAAATHLEGKPWCQGKFQDGDQICLVTALKTATDNKEWLAPSARFTAAAELFRVKHGIGLLGLAGLCDFNNRAGQTKEGIVAALREAAA